MTPAQLRVLQHSFAGIEPHAEQFGATFCDRLFAIAPEMRALFRTDIKAQQSKFMTVIGEVVQLHLRAMISLPVTAQTSGEAMLPGAYWSGKLHAAYGVRMEDFDKMKEAFLWALQHTLKDDLNGEILETWALAYDVVVRAMQSGMESSKDEDQPETNMQLRLNAAGNVDEEVAFLKGLTETVS
jgi:hemoglobin-like flavoprotein